MKSEQSSFTYLLNDIKLALKPAAKFLFLFFPFVLLSLLFIFLFLYFLIANEGGIKAIWLKLILLPALCCKYFIAALYTAKIFWQKKIDTCLDNLIYCIGFGVLSVYLRLQR